MWILPLLFAPAITIGLLIYRFGVDIPHWDQWDGFCQLLEKHEQGTLGWTDFAAAHNEHIIFFPRLVMYGLAALTGWNTRAEMGVVWLLAVLCSLGIWQLARHTAWKDRWASLGLLVAANALIFSLQAYENWLWGFQMAFLMQAACAIGCIWSAVCIRGQAFLPVTLSICVVASFSSAGGLLCWLTAAVLLARRRRQVLPRFRAWWSTAWASGLILTTVLVLISRRQPEGHPGFHGALTHIPQVLRFLLTYAGRPFAPGIFLPMHTLAPIVGAVLMASLTTVAFLLWDRRTDDDFIDRTLPWFMVSVTGLGNAALAAIGRYHMGLDQALSSRYVTFSVFLPMGLLFLGAQVLRRALQSPPTTIVRLGWRPVLGCLLLLYGAGSLKNLADWRASYRQRLRAKALVETINVIDQPELLRRIVHAIVPPLRARMNTLDRLGYLRPPLLVSSEIEPVVGTTRRDAGAFGAIQAAGTLADGGYGLMGWAILPDKRRPADLVLLTLEGPDTRATIIAAAIVGWPLATRPAPLADPAYARPGWRIELAESELMQAPHRLRAWAFDAESGHAYPLRGVVAMKVEPTPGDT